MKCKLKVHANSSQERIEKTPEGFEIWIKEKPIEGRANVAIINLFKKNLGKKIKILSGLTSKNKFIEIENEI